MGVPVPELGVQETSLQYKLLIHTVQNETCRTLVSYWLGHSSRLTRTPERIFWRRQNRGRCSANQPNHDFGGKSYLVSWRSGCTSFSHGEGAAFCRSVGMQPLSLDTPAKERHFTGLVAQERQKYFWTGGNVNHGRNPSIRWPSGRTTTSRLWSNTGGANRPQPDNREGNENCLAVLNNFYNDGVKFHDVSCHHRKPVICES